MSSSAPPQPPPGYLPVANWRYRDVFFAFFAGLLAAIAMSLAVVAIGADPSAPIPFSIIFAAQATGSLGLVWWLSRTRGSGSFAADTGLILRGTDWWGVPAGMGLQIVIALMITPLLYWLYPDGPPVQGVADIAAASETPLEQVLVIIAIAVGAPIVEEVIFRGMLLSILRRSFGVAVSVLISAAVFAGVHLIDPNAIAVVPGLFLLGIVLGLAAIRRGDLSLAVPLHSGVNLLAAISLLWGAELLEWSETQLEELEAIIGWFWLF